MKMAAKEDEDDDQKWAQWNKRMNR